jgi:ApaG protein
MRTEDNYQIAIQVETRYLPQKSNPEHKNYTFSYTMTISNMGTVAARLLSRHWIIKNAKDQVTEVKGDGVIGEQPLIEPGKSYQYTSAAILNTSVGTMEGSYHLLAEDGQFFEAKIAPFTLASPKALH